VEEPFFIVFFFYYLQIQGLKELVILKVQTMTKTGSGEWDVGVTKREREERRCWRGRRRLMTFFLFAFRGDLVVWNKQAVGGGGVAYVA